MNGHEKRSGELLRQIDRLEAWGNRLAIVIVIGGFVIGGIIWLVQQIDLRGFAEIVLVFILVAVVVQWYLDRKRIRTVYKKTLNTAWASREIEILEFHSTANILNTEGDVEITQPWRIIAPKTQKSMVFYFDPKHGKMTAEQLVASLEVSKGRFVRKAAWDSRTEECDIYGFEYVFSEPVGTTPYSFVVRYKLLGHYPADADCLEKIHMASPTKLTGMTVTVPNGYKVSSKYVVVTNDIKDRNVIRRGFTCLYDGFKWVYHNPKFRHFYELNFHWRKG